MKVAVIGTGYVGLVTGTCLAETGNEVVCVDIDEAKVEKMRNGVVPIYEPHLDILFERNIKAKRLRFTTSLQDGLDHGDIIFLALPTPEDEDGSGIGLILCKEFIEMHGGEIQVESTVNEGTKISFNLPAS